MRLAQVVLDIPTQALDAPYTYVIPPEADEAQVGCAVLVPLGSRRAVGFVVAASEWEVGTPAPAGLPDAALDPARLKPVIQVLSHPYFNDDGAACAQFLAARYLAPLSSCVRLFTPPGGVPKVVHDGRSWQVRQPSVGEVDDRWVRLGPAAEGFTPKKNAVKQAQVLDALRHGELRVADLAAEYGQVNAVLKTLAARGVVVVEHRRRMRGTPPQGRPHPTEYAAVRVAAPQPPQLTPGQADALAAIRTARDAHDGRVVVVDGVTGSGKTEVYLRAIQDVVEAGQTAIVLVPEISLTPQTVARFRGRFGDMVAVMHSRMGAGERYDQWDFIRSGAARVVVGARSALFTPVEDLGLIVIDEEHETTYKQESAPRYVARDVAAWMARRAGAALVLGSATPSIEALHAAATDPLWTRVSLPERANGRPMPKIDVVDMAQEFRDGSRKMFSRALQRALHDALAARTKAVLLLNQRGFASFLLCRDCGYVPSCPDCSTSLTFHEVGNRLVCHHCGREHAAPARCPQCGSPYLKRFGAGTQRVEAELRALVAGFGKEVGEVQVIRMDADTTSGKGAHARLLEQFAQADAAVLLGTQMIAKGLDFDDVTLVGVINADTQLRLPDFRSAERTFDLIEQVAGRAGRAGLPGRVIVQTYSADAAPIRAAAAYDRAAFLRDELPRRRELAYPPYARICEVLAWGKDEAQVRAAADGLYEAVARRVAEAAGDAWTVLPATPCVLSRLRGAWRYHVIVKAPPDADVAGVLAPVFRGRKAGKAVNVAVDIDPTSLL